MNDGKHEANYFQENVKEPPSPPLVVDELIFEESTRSSTIGKFALALSKAQLEIEGAKKDATNPFFHSSYADLSSVWDACHEPLNKQEIAIVQLVGNDKESVLIETMLIHSSGEWVRSKLSLKPKATDPQGMGSAITYGRRYALSAIAGVCQIDDDGEKAMGRAAPAPVPAIAQARTRSSLTRPIN